MRKRKLIKMMSRKFLSGLLCVVLTAGSVMPMEMHVWASEAQTEETEENADNTEGGYLEELDSDLAEDSDLGEDSAKLEEDEAESVPQEKEDGADKTEPLPEEDKETQGNSVVSDDADHTDETDKEDKADKTEEIPTTQAQSEQVKEEDSDKADVESTEAVEDVENVEVEETEDASETETEVVEEIIDNGDGFSGGGTSGAIRWDINGETLTVTVNKEGTYERDAYGDSPWQKYIIDGNITTVVIQGAGLTDAHNMFRGLTQLQTVTFKSTFNASKLTNTDSMFSGCYNLTTIDLSKLNGANITTMDSMFYGCSSLNNIDLSKLTNITKVESMQSMFYGCSSLSNITLGGNTAKVTNMSYMFSGCRSLAAVDLSKLNTGSVTNMSSMFSGCSGLTTVDLSKLNTSNVTNMSSMFSGCSGLTTVDLSKLNTSNVTNMSYMFSNCSNSYNGLKSITFGGNTAKVQNMSYMFSGCRFLNNVDLTKLDTSSVITMQSMFSNCTNLDDITFGSDTSNVTNMAYMFSGCTKLNNWNFKKLNTSNVQNMAYMFANCTGMAELDISPLNTSNVTNMSYMFSGCTGAKKLKLENDTKSVINMSYMFYNCKSLEDITFGSAFNADKVTTMFHMFDKCTNLKTLDLSSFNAINVLTMSYMFSDCINLTTIDLSSFNADKVTDMSYMFYNCSGLETLDLSSFRAGSVVYMQYMLYNCSSLKTADFSDFNTSKAEDMQYMLYNCGSLESLDLTSCDTGNVKNMQYMFTNCGGMTELTFDTEKFKTGNVTSMQSMFSGCNRLRALDTSRFNTAKVTSMQNMFSDCNSLESLDVGSFNTANVSNMREMFSRCNSLEELDVSNFDTSKITDMYGMFFLCINLKKLDVSGFDTKNVTTMRDMFYSCRNLKELDLSKFDASKVTDVWNMLSECVGLNMIHTPLNLNLILPLPKENMNDRWTQSGGEIVTVIPQNLDYSIMLLKNKDFKFPCIIVQKEKTTYDRGEVLNVDDLIVTYYDANGIPTVLTDDQYTTNADEIDMRKTDETNEQTLRIYYRNGEDTYTDAVVLKISGKIAVEISGITLENVVYNAEMVSYHGEPVITDKKTNKPIETTEGDISLVYGYKGWLMDGTPYPYTENGKPPVNAGHYTLVVAVEESNQFYTGSCEINFIIYKAPVTITVDDVMLPLGYPLPEKSEYTYKVEGLLKGDKLIKEPSFDIQVDMSKVGTTSFTPNDADAGGNYEITYVGGTFTVSDRQMVKITGIEINNKTYNALPVSYKGTPVAKVYDNEGNVTEEDVTEYVGRLIYTYSGELADGTVYRETSEAPVNVGSYTLNVKVSDSDDRYMGTTKYPFEIHKAPVTITAEDTSMKAGEELPKTFAYAADGLFYNEKLVKEPKFRCNADTSREGSYYIVPYDADAGMNYEVFYVNGLLTVKAEGGLNVEDIPHQVYTGKPIKPEVRVFFDEKTLLTPGKDYTIKFFNNINADTKMEAERRIGFSRSGRGDDGFTKGMAYVVVTGKGNYAGTVYRNFYIDPAKITEDGINEADGVVLKYTDQLVTNEKKAQKAFSSIKYKRGMKLNEDFTLTLTTLKAVVNGEEQIKGNAFFDKDMPVIPANSYGTFELKIEGINNYSGTLTKTVYVTDKAHLMKNAKITLGKNLKTVTYANGGVRLTPAYYDESGTMQYAVSVSTFGEVSSPKDAFTVYMGKECLKYGADKNYIVKYKNNDRVGTATMIIEGKGEYLGTKSINFKISGAAFTAKTIAVNNFLDSMPYTGRECTQDNIELTDSRGIALSESYYTVAYKNNINKGTAAMTLTAKPESGYSGSFKKTYKITSVDIAAAATVLPTNAARDKIEASKEGGGYHLNGTVIYTKNGVKPDNRISLILGAAQEKPVTLVEGKDYTVKYANNSSTTPKGTPTMTITGKGSLTGALTVTFDISKAPLETGENLSITADSVSYNPKAQESSQYQPKIKVTDGKKALKETKDYVIKEYVRCSQKDVQIYLQAKAENKPESELQSKKPYAVITAVDGSDYTGTTEVDLTVYDTKIDAKTLYVVIVDDENYSQTTYTGKPVRPSVEVYYGDSKAVKEAKKAEVTDQRTLTYEKGKYKLKKLKPKRGRSEGDYTLEYGENIKAGKNTGSISVIGAGRYGGIAKVTFAIQGEDVFGSSIEPWSQLAEILKNSLN